MRANRANDTGPEMKLRRALWAAGLRGYRTAPKGLPGRPDVAFVGRRVAVFVHGCFWHGCKIHGRTPRSNQRFWKEKFERNRARDRRKAQDLEANGWKVIVLWEHDLEDPSVAVTMVRTACDESTHDLVPTGHARR